MIAVSIYNYSYALLDILAGVCTFAQEHRSKLWEIVAVPFSREYAFSLEQFPADGLIAPLWPPDVETHVKRYVAASKTPTVIVISDPVAAREFPCVNVDDEGAGRAAAEYFLERGYRSFAFSAAHFPAKQVNHRLNGFAEVLHAKGHLVSVHSREPPLTPPPGVVLAQGEITSWLRSLHHPTALLAFDDLGAREVYRAAAVAKIAVPDQLAILGIENDLIAHHGGMGISSIPMSFRGVGYHAASILDGMFKGVSPPMMTRLPVGEVVTRSSTDARAIYDKDILSAVCFIRERAHDGINVADVLRHVPLGRRTLERRFCEALGTSPRDEIQRVRIEHAKRLLSSTQISIPEIALAAGFPHRSNLFEAFKVALGMSPTEYREKMHAQAPEHAKL